jgi:phage-related protein
MINCNFEISKFNNLLKDYYSESANAGEGKYNTFESFATNSKTDSTLLDFEYENPFSFIPSYGSEVMINFLNNKINYGDGYSVQRSSMLNRIFVNLSLKFDNRSDAESKEIIDFINSTKGYKKFIFQPIKRSGLSSADAYKSLYSLSPYFVQEFTSQGPEIQSNYSDSNNIALNFANQNFTLFDLKSIIKVESMPSYRKAIIDEYAVKPHLDLLPSYAVDKSINLRNNIADFRDAKIQIAEDGVNENEISLNLSYNNIDDEKLLKLLSFIINKQGMQTFTFDVKGPVKERREFLCTSIRHKFVFKGVHDVSISISEQAIKKSFQ